MNPGIMNKFVIQIDKLVHQSMGRMDCLSNYGRYVLYIQFFGLLIAIVNILFLHTIYDNYIAFLVMFLSFFGLYCHKRIMRHMTTIGDSLEKLTNSLDPSQSRNFDLIMSDTKLFKTRIETTLFTIIFKVF